MTRERERRSTGGSRHHLVLAMLIGGLLLLGVMPGAWAQTAARPAAATQVIPAAAVTGMCQCIADRDRRHIGCLASVDQCKAACGAHYSFVPHAPSCALTAGRPGR